MTQHIAAKDKIKQKNLYNSPLFIGVFLFFIIIILIFTILHLNGQQDKSSTVQYSKDDKTTFIETRAAEVDEKYLNNKDYSSYQYSMQYYADNYISKKDYKNAERVLNNILKNVPEDKIVSDTYAYLAILYKESKNSQKYEYNTKLLIESLKKEGNDSEAAYYQKQLDEVNKEKE